MTLSTGGDYALELEASEIRGPAEWCRLGAEGAEAGTEFEVSPEHSRPWLQSTNKTGEQIRISS